MSFLLVAPIAVPLATAVVCLVFWRRRRIQRYISLAGSLVLLAAAVTLLIAVWEEGIQATQLGDWPAPFGITFVADMLSAIMVLATAIVGATIAVYSIPSMDIRRESFGYYPLVQILLAGVCGSLLTGDIFNLFVWFEVMLMSSFVLMALGSERAQLEGAMKYVTLNLFASALFLVANGILYGLTGTLNMADLAVKSANVEPGLMTTVSMLFLTAFGIKAAVFPLFFWLPASYHTPPVAVSALFAGLLTKVGVYALIRVFTLLFVQDISFTHNLILVIAGLTMVTGVLGAVVQNEFRRILSFHIVSQIGYMIMGLGLYTPLALSAAIFFMVHNILAKTNLFLISGITHRIQGSYQLKELGGLYRAYPLLGLLFLLPALSLAGIPPTSGFFGKLGLITAGLAADEYLIVAAGIAVGVMTLYSMIKIWNEVFWKERPAGLPLSPPDPHYGRVLPAMAGPAVFLAVLSVALGFAAEPVFALCNRAAEQLLNPSEYVQAVLGEEQR
jgi:multicomponent Na+:H+ antiporter subunit D